jgi:hypothetical protein
MEEVLLSLEIVKVLGGRRVQMKSGSRPIFYIPEHRLHIEQKDEDIVWIWRDNRMITGHELNDMVTRARKVFNL